MRGLIRVNRYKLNPTIVVGTMPHKKEILPTPKLVSKAAKSAEDLEREEYLRLLELAIENH
jgi:ribosomal protein S10